MTLPHERTRSVINAREFLARLVSPYVPGGYRKIPKPVREEAVRLLRHYPSVVDLKYAAESFSPEEADRIMLERE
jgi:hypothetical protein